MLPCRRPAYRLTEILVVLGAMVAITIGWIFVGLHNHIKRLDEERLQLEKSVDILRGEFSSKPYDNEPNKEDDLVVIYNRVPKTGSTSFVGLVEELWQRNNINILKLPMSKYGGPAPPLTHQIKLVRNITNWTIKKPALYYGHMAYLDYSMFGVIAKPIYINIVRDPLERLISFYYYSRNGDTDPYYIERMKTRNATVTFVECIKNNNTGCQPKDLWLQIPYFCGVAAECWEVGSELALEMAKMNLVKNYLVVGLTEEHADFVAVLEKVLPRFFAGAVHIYTHGNVSHLRQTLNKVPPSEEYRSTLMKSNIWRMENEFYEFAKRQFHFVKDRVFKELKLK